MKKYEITEEQIKEMKSWGNSRDAKKVEKWFPELFEVKLEVGKWYKANGVFDNYLMVWNDGNETYGFYDDLFGDKWGFTKNLYNFSEATEEEVKEALVKEAKKRGYKEGLTIKSELGKFKLNKGKIFIDAEGDLVFGTCKDIYTLFSKGKWAEIIEDEIIEVNGVKYKRI